MEKVNKLEKFIEKMGLYDIWIVFFPGVIFLILLKTLYNFMLSLPLLISKDTIVTEQVFIFCKAKVYIPDTIYEFLVLSLCSYLAGLVLHEISGLIKNRVIYRNGKPTDYLLYSEGNFFSEQEIQKLMPMYTYLYGAPITLTQKGMLKKESNFIFHRINIELQKKKIASQYVKLKIAYNTCGTLEVAIMLVLFIAALFEVEFIALKNLVYLRPVIFLDIFMVICIYFLSHRSKKLYVYWVRNMVFAYQDLYLNNEQNAED